MLNQVHADPLLCRLLPSINQTQFMTQLADGGGEIYSLGALSPVKAPTQS